MRITTVITLATLLALPLTPAVAGNGLRQIMSTGSTLASSYSTFKDHKLVAAAQDDASSFIASEGAIRGPFLEAALRRLRAEQVGLTATDLELAQALLAQTPSDG